MITSQSDRRRARRLSIPKLVAELFLVAKEVRLWAEAAAAPLGHDPVTLQGMCVIAAYEMFDRLSKNPRLAAHRIRFAKSEFHAFVMVDGLTVDVTATQFLNTDPIAGVWIVDLTDEPDPGVWLATEFADSTDAVRQLSCWSRWPYAELPLLMQLRPEPEPGPWTHLGKQGMLNDIPANVRIG